jgi:subtilisin family serine protease
MAVGMSAMLLAALIPAAASARAPFGDARHKPNVDLTKADLDALPSRRDANRVVTVVLELQGRPVALHQGEALEAGRELSEAEKHNLRAPLANRQGVLRSQLRATGARILGSYTDTYNGIKIRVRAGELRRIAAMHGVVGVHPVAIHHLENANTDRYLRAPQTWTSPGFTGNGVSVAVIDSGINYYHRNFAGAGPVAFAADNGLVREPGTFPTAKVVKGYDFVGDDYNPSDDLTTNDDPQPDRDPLDCKDPASPNVQHGSHVAGTAAGTGVLANGSTYSGPYTQAAFDSTNFRIAPGVAPEASLMAYRVFGCDGGSDLVLDAIERAVRDGADVINMSLGSLWGNPTDPSATATDNAVEAGVVVVTSAGNSAASAYITGSPGTATRSISVAALDADPTFPSVVLDMPTGADISGINANGDTNDFPVTGAINVFVNDPVTPCDPDTGEGCEESGTHPDSYTYNGYVAGQIPVVFRGNGARVDRAKQGDAQGAPAVIMVNNSASLPPFEGPISGVDIPFIGVSQADGPRFTTDEGGNVTITAGPELANENYRHRAPFSSGGPGRLDHEIKPDVIAPGVGTFSTDGATANQGKSLSGTSMASPSIAGLAALVLEAHPTWSPKFIKGAIVGSANANAITPYEVRLHGAGVPLATRATRTTSMARADNGSASLAFGYEPRLAAYSEALDFSLWNKSASAVTYNLSNTFNGDAHGATVNVSPSSVTVAPNSRADITVTLSLDAADLAALPSFASGRTFMGWTGLPSYVNADEFGQLFTDLPTVAGAIVADPVATGPNHFDVRVPWLLLPRGASNVVDGVKSGYSTEANGSSRRTVQVKNNGLHSGLADVFAWGIDDGGNEGLRGIDIRVAGVQSHPLRRCFGEDPPNTWPGGPDDRCLVFAVNFWGQWNAASENEVDIYIDLDGDGDPIEGTGYEYLIAGFDMGEILGIFEGVYGAFIIDLSDDSLVDFWFASAPTNSSTVLLAVPASEIGLPKGPTTQGVNGDFEDTEFAYHVEAFLYADDNPIDFPPFDIAHTGNQPSNGRLDARYDAWDPAVSSGNRTVLDPGEKTTFTLRVDPDRFRPREGHKGWLLVSQDDGNGEHQANTIPVGDPRPPFE